MPRASFLLAALALCSGACFAANSNCTGASAGLDAAQCEGWQAFYDGLDGPTWGECKGNRDDPCSCTAPFGPVVCDGSDITGMYANALPARFAPPSHRLTPPVLLRPHSTLAKAYPLTLNPAVTAAVGQLTALTTLILNDARGEIPAWIGQLTALTVLQLNRVSGEIPACIGQLTALKNLTLEGNSLTGTIPASIGQLTALTAL
jgi:hypothetical protein